MMQSARIVHVDELPAYSPPGHAGTVNRRLVEASLGAGFELVLGEVGAGGEAHPHSHDDNWQVVVVLEGMLEHSEPGQPPTRCGPGSVIQIPPRSVHGARGVDGGAKVLVIYSPPLPQVGGFRPA
ncbi:MAG: cupin domain-containing protein [Proteobacteria bacterium]|nr:cupin domain-containing protein [Burkholderiales bacterium]